MQPTNRSAVIIAVLALHSASLAVATDPLGTRDSLSPREVVGPCEVLREAVAPRAPRPKSRAPDDRMLQQMPRQTREVRAPIDLDEVSSKVQVDADAETLFGELPLARPRGTEEPRGPKYGRYCENGFARAGYPFCLGRFAKPSTDSRHQVGYVGGGTLWGGTGRRRDEGTFGMDNSGSWFSRITWLKWSHGARYQGGAGRYETEGPRILPE